MFALRPDLGTGPVFIRPLVAYALPLMEERKSFPAIVNKLTKASRSPELLIARS